MGHLHRNSYLVLLYKDLMNFFLTVKPYDGFYSIFQRWTITTLYIDSQRFIELFFF